MNLYSRLKGKTEHELREVLAELEYSKPSLVFGCETELTKEEATRVIRAELADRDPIDPAWSLAQGKPRAND